MKSALIHSASNQRGTISFAPKQVALLVLVLLIIFVVVFCIVKHATNQEEKVPSYSGDEVEEAKTLYEQLLDEIPQIIAGATVKENAVEEWNLFALENFENTVLVVEENNAQTSDNSYAEIYLINNEERRDAREVYYELGNHAYGLDMTAEDVVIKQEENIILGIFSKRAKELENQLDAIVSAGGTVINCNTTVTWSETETTEESVTIRVAVENNQATSSGTNIEKVVAYVADGRLDQTSNEYELTKNEVTNQYEAEIKFEDLGGREGGYSFSVLVKDDCGNEEYYLGNTTILYSPTGVLSTNVYEKEDGRIAAQITALEKGEVLITATPGTPSVGDANWAKYEAGKEHVLDTIEKGTEKVYVWYKAGDQITNVANSGFSVMSYADGIGVLMEGNWGNRSDEEVFRLSDCKITKKEVISITLSNRQTPPGGDIVETFDVSKSQNGSVTAWFVKNTEDTTKYDLYIGGNGTLIAPANSYSLFEEFLNCKKFQGLEFLEVSNHVTNMSKMFYNCGYIADLTPLANWKVDNVTDISNMFSYCRSITDLRPLQNWNVSSVINMGGVFYSTGITDLTPLKNWKVDNVTNMAGAFFACTSITDLEPLANWKVDNVTDMSSIFYYCRDVTDLGPLRNWNMSNAKNLSGMFEQSINITNLEPLREWKVDNVTDMSEMFYNPNTEMKITNLEPLKDWNVSNVTNMANMFGGCTKVTDLEPLRNWNVGNVKYMNGMFATINYEMDITNLEPLKGWNVANVIDMSKMFYGCTKIASLDPIKGWNVGNVTNMSEMFGSNTRVRMSITSIDPIKNWNVGNVTNMLGMFFNCQNLRSADLSNWNTSKVTSNYSMFEKCIGLKYLLLGNTFGKIQSGKDEKNEVNKNFAELYTSIITFREDPIQFLKYSSNAQYCPATLFVKNTDTIPSLESTFETADTENMFGPERIEEVIGLIGENPLTVSLGTTYKDPGVNVGLYPASDLENYPDLKLTLETDASAVENALKAGNTGEYVVTYTLKYDGTEFCKETRTVVIEKPAFIMEWTIPAGADGNDASGNPQTIIQLPIMANAGNNYTVDWGDGQQEVFGSTADRPSHTYHNTVEQTYVIKVTGRVQSFGYGKHAYSNGQFGNSRGYEPTKEYRSEYYSFTQYLTKIIAWGELDTKWYGFSFCENLREIASPTAETFKNVTDFCMMFMYCSELKSIPEDLFAGARKAEDFSYVFYECNSLSGTISENLFANNLAATDFGSAFYMCRNLSGQIPETLFANNTMVTSFSNVFRGCSGLSGTIPENLFKNNLVATDFLSIFVDCSGLSGEIPKDLFANNVMATNFSWTFRGCGGLSGTIPEKLFANNPKVTTFSTTFSGCSGLTGMIPADLFVNNPLASNFSNTFSNCSGLTAGEITLNSKTITNMDEMFRGCSNLESLVFGSEFKDLKGVNMFADCGNLKAIILLNDTSSPDQVGTILEELNNGKTDYLDKDLGLPDSAMIYVANKEVEKVYEQVWSHVPTNRIRPLIEVKEPNPMEVALGNPFNDPGYTVAGFETTEKQKYEQYGFYVTIDGAAGDITATLGEKQIRYHLKDR